VYRGRLAPSPTGFLHLGHARTFWIAQQRAEVAGGTLILRNEDLDHSRCRPEFVSAMFEDLRWFGFHWSEGPDVGGPHAPYIQSARMSHYIAAFERLRNAGLIYPCTCSRQDVLRALTAPHHGDDEPIYPGTCRPALASQNIEHPTFNTQHPIALRAGVNWRFRVREGSTIRFIDLARGPQCEIAGEHFGDFLIWRKDDFPAYQLACVMDDATMEITEVVRGADLIGSTFRQLLLYRALEFTPPAFYHCDLVTDEHGVRLAKRHDALSLRAFRESGASPEQLRARLSPQPQ
jgi:glutamyl/glutaminyl-tRNA synthetase